MESLGAKMRPYRRFDTRYGKYRYGYAMWTPVDEVWLEYRRLVYDENGRKQISAELLEQADEISLAVWICDDGSWNNNGGQVRINSHRYGLEGNERAEQWFEERWHLYPHVLPHKQWFFLFFPAKETKKLIDLIEPAIPVASMMYKLGKTEKEWGPSAA